VNDDVYAVGQHVTIDGRINGNLITTAGALRVNGAVSGSVFALSGSVRVHGHIARDVTVASGKVTVDPGADVGRDVVAATGAAVINGHVGRNVQLGTGSVRLGSAARIGGDLTYWGGEKPKLQSGAVVQGMIRHEDTPSWMTSTPFSWGDSIIGWFRGLVGILALGLIFIWLAPAFGRHTVETLRRRPWASAGSGLLFLVAVPIIAALVFIVGIFTGGWWLSLVGLSIYWIALVLSIAVAGLFVGRWILEHTGQRAVPLWTSLVLGVVLIMLASVIPVVGGVVLGLAGVVALGGLVLTALRSSQTSHVAA
jgi:cytoskeletal protein CcmA (bactofilin family)